MKPIDAVARYFPDFVFDCLVGLEHYEADPGPRAETFVGLEVKGNDLPSHAPAALAC